MFEISAAAMPQRCRFPGTATVKNKYGSLIEAGECIRADGVGQMMVHKAEGRLRRPKDSAKAILAAALVPHAEKIARRIEHRARIHRLLAGGVAAEIMHKSDARRRPSLANKVQL